MSLLRNASGVLPLAVQHLPQTQSAVSDETTSTPSRAPTRGRLRTFVSAITVSGLVLAIMVALIAALASVSH
jgi:hypothetical protein